MISLMGANIAFLYLCINPQNNMKKFSLFIILVITLLSGCNNYRDIEILDVKLTDVKILSTSRAEVELEYVVRNGSSRDLTLTSTDGFLKKEGVNFAQFRLIESGLIERGKTSSNKTKINVELLDPISLFSLGLNINSWKMSVFQVDVRCVISNDRGNKSVFKFKNLPLEKLVNKF